MVIQRTFPTLLQLPSLNETSRYMSAIRASSRSIIAASALALAACSDPTVAPVANIALPSRPAMNATIGTVPTTRRDLEGQFWVCKVANAGAPQETFNFTYSAIKLAGSTQPDLPPGTVSIKNGECAMLYSIDRETTVRRYAVTVTEGVLPVNWTFGSASISTIAPFNSFILGAAVVNGQEVSGVGFTHDQGAVLTITNTYTPPTGQIGDFVWDDVNGNGIQDMGEPGIAGVTVTLSGAASASATTNTSGAYLFTGLSAGSYTVTVDGSTLPAGFVATATGQGTAATDNNGSPASVTLATSSSVDLTIDFGYTQARGQIGDFVWNDLNGNGIQDSGEPGLAGITVTLGGAASATTTTNASGAYSFTGLFAGSYTVTVGTPSGFSASPSAQGGDPTKDSNGSPASVTLATNNSTNMTIDFGFVPNPTGQIGNFVWDDVNGNGIQDMGEPGIAGVTVTLSGAASATATTSASGAYLFTGLSAGSYTVTVSAATLPAGFVATQTGQGTAATDNNGSPASVTLATSSSVDLTIDFGYTTGRGQIGDFVWNDLNGNGIQDIGEPGLSGVVVTLGGAKSATTTTNANGAYLFSGLSAGSYTVTVGTVAGFNPTTANAGGDPSKDSNTNPSNVTLAANNSTNFTIDFGFVAIPKTGPSCTLTQGYWKNHQEEWDKQGERIVWNGQTFFKSGKTFAQIMAMNPSGGNSYIQLAHQYIAAKLNVNGGSDPVIDASLAQAETLFNSLAQGTTFIKNATWTSLASKIDDYNNGVTGPGHCN